MIVMVKLLSCYGALPVGCRICMEGAKVVVFITGLCDDKCFYCPVSRHKLGRDIMYVDEEPVRVLNDIIEESIDIDAKGAGITGGDPLIVLPRTLRVIRELKASFGDSFHIHLYTSGRYATRLALKELARAGLDEIRFHPVKEEYWNVVRKAVEVIGDKVDVGVEIPIFPDNVDKVFERIKWLDRLGVSFINLNEVEVTPDNLEAIRAHGYTVMGNVVKGSAEAGIELVERSRREGLRISVHFCSARFKDVVQFRLRMKRKAIRLAQYYEEVTSDGTLISLKCRAEAQTVKLVDEGYGVVKKGAVYLTPRLKHVASCKLIEYYPSKKSRLILYSQEE